MTDPTPTLPAAIAEELNRLLAIRRNVTYHFGRCDEWSGDKTDEQIAVEFRHREADTASAIHALFAKHIAVPGEGDTTDHWNNGPVPYVELNMGNYGDDDVAQLNNWGIWAAGEIAKLATTLAAERAARERAEARVAELEGQVEKARTKLEEIVCTAEPDDGVILLSDDGPTHYDPEQKCQVYDHKHFSPLGDALIDLHESLKEKGAGE